MQIIELDCLVLPSRVEKRRFKITFILGQTLYSALSLSLTWKRDETI